MAGAILAAALGSLGAPLSMVMSEPPRPLPDAPVFLGRGPKRYPKRPRYTSRERKGRWPGTAGKIRP